MNKRKRFLLTFAFVALINQGSSAYAIDNQYSNQLLKLNFEKGSDGNVNVTVYSSKQYKLKITPIKRADNKYIILLPETYHSLTAKPDTSFSDGTVQDVDVKLIPYVGYSNNGYTKVVVKTADNVKLNVNNTAVQEETNLTDDLSQILKDQSKKREIKVVQKQPQKLKNSFNKQQSEVRQEKYKAKVAAKKPVIVERNNTVQSQPDGNKVENVQPEVKTVAADNSNNQHQVQPISSVQSQPVVPEPPQPVNQNTQNPLLPLIQKLLIIIIAFLGSIWIFKKVRGKKITPKSVQPNNPLLDEADKSENILARLYKTKSQGLKQRPEIPFDTFMTASSSPAGDSDEIEFKEVMPNDRYEEEEEFLGYIPQEEYGGFDAAEDYMPQEDSFSFEEVPYSNNDNDSEFDSYLIANDEPVYTSEESLDGFHFEKVETGDSYYSNDISEEQGFYVEENSQYSYQESQQYDDSYDSGSYANAQPEEYYEEPASGFTFEDIQEEISDEPEFLNAHEFSPDKGIYLVNMKKEVALVAVINSEAYTLTSFKNLQDTSLIVELNKSNSVKTLYTVKIGDWKGLVSVTSNEINLEFIY